MVQARYTLAYRATQARQVMDWVRAGQSGCLIGLRGAGKSNFFHFLLRQDVQQHYLGPDHANFVLVLIDLLALVERADWVIYSRILDRLLDKLDLLKIEKETVQELRALYQRVVRSRDPLNAQRAVERFMDVFCQQPQGRVVLLLDEFDAVFRSLDPSLFRCLRAIRDMHKDQVSYIITVASDLAHLRDDLAPVEHFYRLVSRNTCGLGPYDAADARRMIDYLASRRSVELGATDIARLIELSGGHAGLIKATLSLLWGAHQDGGLAELTPGLSGEPAIQTECRKVWDSLPESEQAALRALARGMHADPLALHSLEIKGLVQRGRLFSPLFADFIPLPAQGLSVRRSPPVVQIADRRVETLTELEFETLAFLYERQGQVCTKDELIANVYRQQYDRMAGGVSDEALQTLISRLRNKIEPERQRPRYIVTVRGEGYKLVEPDEG